jgi:uncharacterized membrane protein YbhN (UPF0104 family)
MIFALLRHFELRQMVESIRQAHFGLVILGVALMVCAYALRGARWWICERSLSYWNSLRLILIGFMAENVLPARLAEVLRAHCSAAKTDKDGGRTIVFASIATERIVDGLMLSVLGLLAAGLIHIDGRLRWAPLLVSLVFVGLGAALVPGFRHDEWVFPLSGSANPKFPGRVTAFGRQRANRLIDGLLLLGTSLQMFRVISITAIIWSIDVGVCYCFGLSVWHDMTLRVAVLFLVAVKFASLLPLTIGGIGPIEVAGALFLIYSSVPPHLALAMVLQQHVAYYAFTTITGGIL